MTVKAIAVAALVAAAAAAPAWAQSGGGLIDEMVGSEGGASGSGPAIQEPPATDIGEVQGAWDTICDGQARGPATPVSAWDYDEYEVRCLRVREHMPTLIVLPEWEEVIDIVNGDKASFKVGYLQTRKNVVAVETRGAMVGTDTTLTLIGSAVNGAAPGDPAPWGAEEGGRNVYSFYVRSYPVDAPEVTTVQVKVLAGRGGRRAGSTALTVERAADDPTQRARREARRTEDDGGTRAGGDGESEVYAPKDAPPEYLREIAFNVEQMRFEDYEIRPQDAESESIAPIRVFHDGVFTFMDFGEGNGGRADRILAPVALEVVDQIDSKVNQRWTGPDGNILVVEAVGDFTLKNGQRVVCIRYAGGNAVAWEPRTGPDASPAPGGG